MPLQREAGHAAERLVQAYFRVTLALARDSGRDLTGRQMAVFLACFLDPEPQTVRGLAERLHVSRPAISRILDRLQDRRLVTRVLDHRDRRSVLVIRRGEGWTLFLRLQDMIVHAASSAGLEDGSTALPQMQGDGLSRFGDGRGLAAGSGSNSRHGCGTP